MHQDELAIADIELDLLNCPQQIAGHLGNICDSCNKRIYDGEAVAIDACNPPMGDDWEIDRIYCSNHLNDEDLLVFEGTDDYDEVSAHATYRTRHPLDGRRLHHVRDIMIQHRSAP